MSCFIGRTSFLRSLPKLCCGAGPAQDEGSTRLRGWSSAISFEGRTPGCGFNPACPRGCGCGFVFPERRASGVESTNPTCRMQFWLRFDRVLLSTTLAPTWELWLFAQPNLWATWAVL